ncbi:LPS-assembly protein LptD [Falsiroseomonas sp. HW251]|uniref:LPS-assembly protein LptD n=1 Tax=Falsiroseomonas sp. HW251 TaxID=3390998 RepID=UPI003D315BDB
MRVVLSRILPLLCVLLAAAPAMAQSGLPGFGGPSSNEPVTFTAEDVSYDQNTGVVTASGRVEAWQGMRVLRADRFTYNRETGVATADGNVVMIEPDGSVLFAERAELSGGMRDATLEGLRGLLASNARVAAAGGRRTDGRITDLSRVVYSPCNTCPEDPDRPPLWQLRARIASLHADEQRVRYRDAALEFGGLPLLWTPYLSHAAPGAPRVSGFLSPSFGLTKLLGAFWSQPYYWAIDDSSDALLHAQIGTSESGNLGLTYRRRFNSGALSLDGSFGYLGSSDAKTDGNQGWGYHFFSNSLFALDENWRTGLAINRASSRDYLRAFRYNAPQTLTSTGFVEGFWGGQGYARLDSRLYQNVLNTTGTSNIPFVLPYGYAEWAFRPDSWGGQLTLDSQAYSLFRREGTDSRRIATRASYELPLYGRFGEVYTIRGRADLLAGSSENLNQAPFFSPDTGGGWTMGNARAALDVRWPLMRPAGEWGSHILEPRVQFVTGPAMGTQANIPAEDSLNFDFTDANLFELNRFAGRDRQEGGTRMDAALRGAWLFPNGGQLEGLFGQSWRTSVQDQFPVNSGLQGKTSDYVGRVRLAPVPWFEVLGRARLDNESWQPQLWDLSSTLFGTGYSVTAGYLFAPAAANNSYPQRNEIGLGGSLRINENWRIGGFGRYDIQAGTPASAFASLVYEDECLVFEARYRRSWAEDPSTNQPYAGGTILLLRVTLKTIGDFGIRAL